MLSITGHYLDEHSDEDCHQEYKIILDGQKGEIV